MSASSFDYYGFQRESSIQKINEEIDFYFSSECVSYPFIRDYVIYLKSRIERGGKYTHPKSFILMDKDGNRKEVVNMNMDEYQNDVLLSNFQQEWKKLKPVHKHIKINEYVEGLNEYSKKISEDDIKKNRSYLKSSIINGLTEKRFLKGKSEIEYDIEKGMIKSISCIDFNKKKGVYEIDWDS